MRKKLVNLLRSKGISDENVLTAIDNVPRHVFFDNAFLEHAYQDKAFPIGEKQTISQPYTVAFQTQLLELNAGDKVLEIGTGSGYQASVLMEMGAKVYTIEYNRNLYNECKTMMRRLGHRPIMTCGDGSKGWKNHGPFDKIIVTAGAPSVPEALIEQLAIGGYLVIPVGNQKQQAMLRITKNKDESTSTEEFDYFAFVPLLGEQGWKK